MKDHLLIIDNDPQTAKLILDEAKEWGFSGTWAATGKRAKALIRKLSPRWIILDTSLPDKIGLTLIPELKKVVPAHVVVYTEKEHLGTADAAFMLGADAYIPKSHSIKTLLEATFSPRNNLQEDALGSSSQSANHLTEDYETPDSDPGLRPPAASPFRP